MWNTNNSSGKIKNDYTFSIIEMKHENVHCLLWFIFFLSMFAPTGVGLTRESSGRHRTSSHPATGVHSYPVMSGFFCFVLCFLADETKQSLWLSKAITLLDIPVAATNILWLTGLILKWHCSTLVVFIDSLVSSGLRMPNWLEMSLVCPIQFSILSVSVFIRPSWLEQCWTAGPLPRLSHQCSVDALPALVFVCMCIYCLMLDVRNVLYGLFVFMGVYIWHLLLCVSVHQPCLPSAMQRDGLDLNSKCNTFCVW